MYYRTRFSSYEEFQREAFADPGRELGQDELELLEDLLEDEHRFERPIAQPRRAGLPRWRPYAPPRSRRLPRPNGAGPTPVVRAWRYLSDQKLPRPA